MILKPITIDAYCAIAEPHIGVFASKKWLSIYNNKLNIIGIYKTENQLIGGYFFLKTKKQGISFLKLPPYTPHCGLFFINDSQNTSAINSNAKEIITEVCNAISAQKSAITVLAFPHSIIDLQPFIWQKFKVIPNYTYQLNLQKSIDELKNNFDSKNRNAINKAIKDEVSIAENTLSKHELFNFFISSLNTTNANVYNEELENIFLIFSDNTNSFCQVATKNDQLLGVVFCAFDKNVCYYLLGGINKQAGLQGINNVLVLKSIEKAKQLGCTTFDFEGSMLKGVEKFFRGFGGELIPYYTVSKANIFLEIALKFKKREIF